MLDRFSRDTTVVSTVSLAVSDGAPRKARTFEAAVEKLGRGGDVELDVMMSATDRRMQVLKIEGRDAPFLGSLLQTFAHAVRRAPEIVHEMQLLYAFALYEGAKSDILKSLFAAWPVLISSERTVTFSEAVQLAETGVLQDVLATRETQWYTDKGSKEQFKQLERRLKLKPDEEAQLVTRLDELHALRNVLIHNSGVVDERYSRAVGGQAPPVGSRVSVSRDDLSEALGVLRGYILWLGRSISNRYGTGEPYEATESSYFMLGFDDEGPSSEPQPDEGETEA